MDIARDLAKTGCPSFTVVAAERQKAGRGRLKRVWQSSDGGLYFTLILRPQISPELAYQINFLVSLSLAKTLRSMYHIEAMVKWPNDILVNEKKIVGILSEMGMESDQLSFINLGMGINVNNNPGIHEPKASSLKKILHREVSKKELLFEFLNALEYRMNQEKFENVIGEWKKYTLTIGRQVTVVTTQDTYKGLAIDVDTDGALILKLPDHSIQRVIYGDCFFK